MTLNSQINLSVKATQTGVGDLGNPKVDINLAASLLFADGSGAGQASKVFSDRRTLGGGANEDLDLAGGVTDSFGQTITFATVKAIIVKAADANAQDLVVGNAATNQFVGFFGAAAHTIAVPPGGVLVAGGRGTGKTVTAGTGDLLRVTAGAGGATYDIVIIGT